VLYYREQRSAREVAAALGISEAATLQRLARGRQYLADGLTSLVERSLRAQRRPRRDLVASGVLAPPLIAPSRGPAGTATAWPGGHRWKSASPAALGRAAGPPAYVVHDSHGSAPVRDPVASVAASTASPGETAPAARAAAVRTTPAPPAPQLPRSPDPAA